jgi:small multidrug resistance pump
MYYKMLLVIAIISEVIATSSLKSSQSLTRPLPSLAVIVGYGLAYYLMSVIVTHMYVGTVYALWCGAGITLVSLWGWLYHGQSLDRPALIGISLIIAGVFVMSYSSAMAADH